MEYLPGTTVEVNENNTAQGFLDSAFAMNGLVLSQIVQLTGLEPHTIQNWVKRKFITPPLQKKYDCGQFCRIALINAQRDIFQIERILGMLQYVFGKGRPVDDILVYTSFSEVIAILPEDAISAQTDLDGIIRSELAEKPMDLNVRERLGKAIKIMILAYLSALMKKRADLLLDGLE